MYALYNNYIMNNFIIFKVFTNILLNYQNSIWNILYLLSVLILKCYLKLHVLNLLQIYFKQ